MKSLLYNLRESAAAAPTCAKIWISSMRRECVQWPPVLGEVLGVLAVLLTPITVVVGIVFAHRRGRRSRSARTAFLKDLQAGDALAIAAAKLFTESGAHAGRIDRWLDVVYKPRMKSKRAGG